MSDKDVINLDGERVRRGGASITMWLTPAACDAVRVLTGLGVHEGAPVAELIEKMLIIMAAQRTGGFVVEER